MEAKFKFKFKWDEKRGLCCTKPDGKNLYPIETHSSSLQDFVADCLNESFPSYYERQMKALNDFIEWCKQKGGNQ